MIVENADCVTRHIMRQTCSIFLAAIGAGDARQFEAIRRGNSAHQVVPWECPYSLQHPMWDKLVWPIHEPPRQIGRDQLANLLARDRGRRCDACHEYQESGQIEKTLWLLRHPLWCSGCRKYHPLLFFSAKQRETSPDQRICIGREGKVRLCSHESLTWAQLHSAARSAKYSADPVTIKSCSNKSHNSPKSWWRSPIFPELALLHKTSSVTARYSVHITWTSPVFDLDSNVPIRKENIRDCLASQEKESYLFEHAFCPHVTNNDGQLLLPFEPNQCVCFESHEETITSTAPCHHCTEMEFSFNQCCRCLAATSPYNKDNNPQGHFMYTDSLDYHKDYLANHNTSRNGFEARNLDEHHAVSCSQCHHSRYAWKRSGRGGRRVYIDFVRIFDLPESPTSMAWLKNLDPESWGISQDHTLRHVLWCPESRCSTRQGYSQFLKALNPHTDEGKARGLSY
ncbi:hypothetical protein V8F20_003661 [Naviculisporaceae sp. PSN 640]